MTTITEDLDLPDGTDPQLVKVSLELWGAGAPVTGYEQGSGKTIAGAAYASGAPWSITNVVGNSAIDAPAGTVYRLTRTWPGLLEPLVDFLDVPAGSGTFRVDEILTDPPAAVESSALGIHARDTIAGPTQLHGVLEHRWAADGWTPFERKIINQDGGQVFTLSVAGDYGRVTGSVAGSGNHRELYVHEGMTAVDGELTAIIKGPSIYGTGNRPQGGLCLGYQLIGGAHCAYVVWYDIVASNPRVWNVSGWRGDGSPTLNQPAGGQYTADIARDLKVMSVMRFNFGAWINELTCVPLHLYGIAAGDAVTVDVDDNTFDATAVALSNAGRETGTLQYLEDLTTSSVAAKFASGTVQLADGHKRFFPLAVRARRVGTQIAIKVWRAMYDPEPRDWQLTQTVAPDADFPVLPSGDVPFGLVAGHAHDGSYLDVGDLTFRRLA